MKKIYHLGSCNTCQRIIKSLGPLEGFELQGIKTEPLGPDQLEALARLAGSYGALFSKRARLYREMGLHEKTLGESDFKALILEHYTFLKRPVILIGDNIFIGNSKKTVQAAQQCLRS